MSSCHLLVGGEGAGSKMFSYRDDGDREHTKGVDRGQPNGLQSFEDDS